MERLTASLLAAILVAASAGALAAPESGVGRSAPDCDLTLVGAGAQGALHQMRGSVLYVDFWASWCAPCLLSFPFMNRLQQEFANQGLRVVALDMDQKAQDGARFLAKHPVNFAVGAGENEACAKRFGVEAMPTSYLIDRSGVIRLVHAGFRPGDEGPLRAAAAQVLGRSPVK